MTATPIQPDGIDAAAMREEEFHPQTQAGKPITAWKRRAATLKALTGRVNEHERRIAEIEEVLRSRPF
jgi:hypothetical protein